MVYAFHKEDYGNSDLDNHVCERINTGNYTIINDRIVPKGIHCHWYHHDWTGGVQVMIVSSEVKQYVAVVFAGTDDFRTSITDVNIRMTEFGSSSGVTADENRNNYVMDPPSPYPVYNVSLPDPKIRVHAGFDHAVFDRNLFGEVVVRVESIRKPDDRILTTGHSLGAANAVLTAVGFIQYYEQVRQQEHRSNDENNVHQASSEAASSRVLPPVPDRVVSINFGCPQTGNTAWRDFLHTDAVIKRRLSIWRFVLGWDLVPRLPEVLQHVGHTVQLSYSSYTAEEANQTASAYYHHIGNETMQLAGVPFGWGAKPFVWVPGAIFSHVMNRYCKFLIDCNNNKNNNNNHRSSSDQQRQPWVDSFVRVNGDERPLPNVDDDFYVEPPDDDALDVQMQ